MKSEINSTAEKDTQGLPQRQLLKENNWAYHLTVFNKTYEIRSQNANCAH